MSRDAEIPEPLRSGAPIIIGTRQSTFWDVATHDGVALYRIYFIGKVEFRFVTRAADAIAVATVHPLLLDYVEPEASLYISSKPDDPHSTVEELSRLAEGHFCGWRSLARYLNKHVSAAAVLSAGYGLLLRGPRSFVEAAESILTTHGVQCQLHEGPGPGGRFLVLELGRNYVVAERFEFKSIAHAA